MRLLQEDMREVAYWNGMYWFITESENPYKDEDFSEIDEKQIKRE